MSMTDQQDVEAMIRRLREGMPSIMAQRDAANMLASLLHERTSIARLNVELMEQSNDSAVVLWLLVKHAGGKVLLTEGMYQEMKPGSAIVREQAVEENGMWL